MAGRDARSEDRRRGVGLQQLEKPLEHPRELPATLELPPAGTQPRVLPHALHVPVLRDPTS